MALYRSRHFGRGGVGTIKAGDEVTLEVTLRGTESPESAYMRIESAPLKTEHVVVMKLA
jgi:hypothetical protein